MNLESSLLRYFREVYRLKSIRQASTTLNVAPSAVSRQIHRLEQMVGVALFERLPRGVAPTEAADVLARFSRNFLLDIERVRGEPVYLILAMTPERTIRMKPQNLVTGLPLRDLEHAA